MKKLRFDQLSDEAKAKAIEQYRSWDIDHDWWIDTYTFAKTVGEYIGIIVHDDVTHRNAEQKPNIQFSGFWSQGDGCCFTGEISVPKLFEMSKFWTATTDTHTVKDRVLTGIQPLIDAGKELYNAVVAVEVADALDPEDEEWSECRTYASIHLIGAARGCFYTTLRHGELFPEHVGKLAEALAEAFAAWIYNELRTVHEDITSVESLTAELIANEYLFAEDGQFIPG